MASAGVLYGYIKVAERAWLIAPVMWLLLMVMVPPVVVNVWLRTGRPRLTLAAHQATVARYRAEAAHEPAGETVDVFLPSCGEPLAVLDNTFRHVSALTWHADDDRVRARRLGPGGRARPGGPVRLPVRGAPTPGRDEEGG